MDDILQTLFINAFFEVKNICIYYMQMWMVSNIIVVLDNGIILCVEALSKPMSSQSLNSPG